MTNADKIQAVINTLEMLSVPPTYNNCNYMTGIYNTLVQVRDDLIERSKDDGKADAE